MLFMKPMFRRFEQVIKFDSLVLAIFQSLLLICDLYFCQISAPSK